MIWRCEKTQSSFFTSPFHIVTIFFIGQNHIPHSVIDGAAPWYLRFSSFCKHSLKIPAIVQSRKLVHIYVFRIRLHLCKYQRNSSKKPWWCNTIKHKLYEYSGKTNTNKIKHRKIAQTNSLLSRMIHHIQAVIQIYYKCNPIKHFPSTRKLIVSATAPNIFTFAIPSYTLSSVWRLSLFFRLHDKR